MNAGPEVLPRGGWRLPGIFDFAASAWLACLLGMVVEVVPLREYELVMVLRPDVPDEDVPATIERVQQFVSGRGGAVLSLDTWGRRKLAYPIKKYFEGNYIVTQLRLEPQDVRELENTLRLNDHVIRHLLVRTDEH